MRDMAVNKRHKFSKSAQKGKGPAPSPSVRDLLLFPFLNSRPFMASAMLNSPFFCLSSLLS